MEFVFLILICIASAIYIYGFSRLLIGSPKESLFILSVNTFALFTTTILLQMLQG